MALFPAGTSCRWRVTKRVQKIAILHKRLPWPVSFAVRAWNRFLRAVPFRKAPDLIARAQPILARAPSRVTDRVIMRVRQVGPYLVPGLAGTGALMLLFTWSFLDLSPAPNVTRTEVPERLAEASAIRGSDRATLSPPTAHIAEKRAQVPPSDEDQDMVHHHDSSAHAEVDAVAQGRADVSTDHLLQSTSGARPVTGSVSRVPPSALNAVRSQRRGGLRGPSVQLFATPSGRGRWLHVPTPISGANS
jgi:hypothetical protein